MLRPIYHQHRRATHPEVAAIPEKRQQIGNEGSIALWRIRLLHKQLLLGPIPLPRPILIGPTQAEAYIRFRISQEILYRTLQ